MGAVLVSMLSIPKTNPKEDPDPSFWIKKVVAGILNQATDSGISISKSEIPAAFLRASAPPA